MELSNESEKRRQARTQVVFLKENLLTVIIPVGTGGSSFNDLSLTGFLDKFMEKKPKQNTWRSGSKSNLPRRMATSTVSLLSHVPLGTVN
ncbi:unnamed protein product [Brassica oleracea]